MFGTCRARASPRMPHGATCPTIARGDPGLCLGAVNAVRRRMTAARISTRHRNRYCILAEDDAVLRRLLNFHLAAWGLTVIEASDRAHLADVMEVLRRDAGAGIDVIVSELQMLGMGGLEIRSRLRAGCGYTPMILLCASSDAELATEAARSGAVVFGKPFDMDDLGTAVVNAVTS